MSVFSTWAGGVVAHNESRVASYCPAVLRTRYGRPLQTGARANEGYPLGGSDAVVDARGCHLAEVRVRQRTRQYLARPHLGCPRAPGIGRLRELRGRCGYRLVCLCLRRPAGRRHFHKATEAVAVPATEEAQNWAAAGAESTRLAGMETNAPTATNATPARRTSVGVNDLLQMRYCRNPCVRDGLKLIRMTPVFGNQVRPAPSRRSICAFDYAVLLRRRKPNSPNSPAPSSAIEEGSGTVAGLGARTSIVKL